MQQKPRTAVTKSKQKQRVRVQQARQTDRETDCLSSAIELQQQQQQHCHQNIESSSGVVWCPCMAALMSVPRLQEGENPRRDLVGKEGTGWGGG